MKTEKRIETVVLLFAVFALAVAVCITVFCGAPNNARAEEWTTVRPVASAYALGSELTVPEYTVTAKGHTATASHTLLFPSGKNLAKDKVVLDEKGLYTLSYAAKAGNEVYTKTLTFKVGDKLVSCGKTSSQVTYGEWIPSDAEVAQNTHIEGLMVRLSEGDTLYFANTIDVKNVSMRDMLVEAFATPDECGTPDFEKAIFTFTDAEDPSVYLRVSARAYYNSSEYPTASFWLAGGNGQSMKGYEARNNKLHVANEWGAPIRHSFYGVKDGYDSLNEIPMRISFDTDTKKVYSRQDEIIDLDSPEYYTSFWYGFPSGKAKLSITADVYNKMTANFCITAIRGLELSDASVAEIVTDDVAPVIAVDTDYETMPNAVQGGVYPVPTATATDAEDGDRPVTAEVYFNYTSVSGRVRVEIENGKFATDRKGMYTVVYTAKDVFGNTAQEFLWVESKESVADISVTLDTPVKIDGVLGELIPVAQAYGSGGSGTLDIRITATCGETEYDATRGGFRPEKAGVYTVSATATDYLGNVGRSDSYTVHVTAGTSVLFIDDPLLPPTFIHGNSYTLPTYYVHDYTGGTLVRRAANIVITDAKTAEYRGGDVYVPDIAANGDTVNVVLKCGDAESEPYTVKGVVPFDAEQKLHLENYLTGNGFIADAKSTGITVTAHEANAGWTFANKLIAEKLVLGLRGNENANFDALRIVLTDAAEPSVSIETRLVNDGENIVFEHGGSSIQTAYGFKRGSAVEFKYESGVLSIGNYRITAERTTAGKAFCGFASDFVYVSVYFENGENTAYELREVAGHPMNNSSRDRIKPRIVMCGATGGTASLGSEVTLPRAVAGDTLTASVTFSFTVKDPNGEIVTDVNGVRLENADPTKEYVIKADTYGVYNVSYTAADTNEQGREGYTYAVRVEDEIAPEITVQGKSLLSARVGDVLTVPAYTVTDNLSAPENIDVIVTLVLPRGTSVRLHTDAGAVVATQAGTYEFRIMAVDEAGNIDFVRVTVTVSA